MAVFTLPPPMFGFFKKHIEFLTEHAVDPDKRRYAVEGEAPRHYIDIDHYVKNGEDPFDVVPKRWDEAVAKFSEDTLRAYGIVPWQVSLSTRWLEDAFRKGDTYRILRAAADLGHYVGDAHVPLHTTENYNGQLTGQRGIHGFWESRVPELFAEEYDYLVGKAEYKEDVLDFIWTEVKKSNRAVDTVLSFERILSEQFSSDKKYGVETRGTTTIQTYSFEFSKEYSDMMDDMVQRRMRQSIISLGSLWYTAWLNAGQPDLEGLGDAIPTAEDLEEEKELDNKFNGGEIKGREHPH